MSSIINLKYHYNNGVPILPNKFVFFLQFWNVRSYVTLFGILTEFMCELILLGMVVKKKALNKAPCYLHYLITVPFL